MKKLGRVVWSGVGSVFRSVRTFRRETGRSLGFWALLALFAGATQIVFRRELAPGEFGMLNSLLALAGVLLLPVAGLRHAFDHFVPGAHDPARAGVLRDGRLPLVQIVAIGWAVLALILSWPLLALLGLPRASLAFCLPVTVLMALAALVAAALSEQQNRLRGWAVLVFLAALVRLLAAWCFTSSEPWAEMGLAAGWAGAFVLLVPVWRAKGFELGWAQARAVWRDREFLWHLLATFSVLLGLDLFINGDRIVAQAWFGRPQENNINYVPWSLFDSYQTAGLLARALLWGTQPLLLLLLVRRSGAPRTTSTIRNLFWVYLAALVGGAALLFWCAPALVRFFEGGDDATTVNDVHAFLWVMFPIGLLQGLGSFALASRRYPECFTLGVASLGYVALLEAVGRPQLMLTYAFGGSFVALMLVLMVGVVRWGRRHP